MGATELHRRRRLRALGLVALIATALGALAGSRAGDGEGGSLSAATPFCEQTGPYAGDGPGAQALDRVAGQSVMVRMEARAGPALIDAARSGEIGGVILFPPPGIRGDRLAAELRRLQAAALDGGNPKLLVAIDQEGGIVKRLPALAPQLSPFALAQNDDARAARLEGRATGFQLRELGIDVNLAPVMDVPASPEQFMAPRAFGFDPAQVSRLSLAFAQGLRQEAVAATAKHFPGLGRATENTDFAPTTIDVTSSALRRDLAPFRAASAAGIELMMVSSASYPALGSRTPAVLAPEVVATVLRGELGYQGVVVSDDLLAPAITAEHSQGQAAVLAAVAGVDLLLFARRDAPGVAAALVAAIADGRLDEPALRASCGRILTLKEALAAGQPLD